MSKEKEYAWIAPRMAEMRSRYPEPAMIDGLQPALTSDIMEIVAEARREERERCVKLVKSRIYDLEVELDRQKVEEGKHDDHTSTRRFEALLIRDTLTPPTGGRE